MWSKFGYFSANNFILADGGTSSFCYSIFYMVLIKIEASELNMLQTSSTRVEISCIWVTSLLSLKIGSYVTKNNPISIGILDWRYLWQCWSWPERKWMWEREREKENARVSFLGPRGLFLVGKPLSMFPFPF